MSAGFANLPQSPRFALVRARIPGAFLDVMPSTPDSEGLVAADIVINDGKVESIEAPGSQADFPHVDLDDGMVWPTFTDMHTHLDKGHIWPRKPNPNGTFEGALEATLDDRAAHWSAEDIGKRMDFSLRCAYAHGTSLIRTHIDSGPPQHKISWPVFAEMRDRWAGRIDLQGSALLGADKFPDDDYAKDIVQTVKDHGGILGAVAFMIPELDDVLDRMMRAAADAELDLDFHADETGDPKADALRRIADAAIRNSFPGRIVVGHCCSLAIQPAVEAESTMERVAEAGLSVVSLPMCNLYLQGRGTGGTPHWRGVTLLKELDQRDVPVAVASDNTRDPFYAYGDLDMVEVFREAVRILQLDHPVDQWAGVASRDPARIIGREDVSVIRPGLPADLVLFRARAWTEFLSRPQSDRTVLRQGNAIDRTLPDYRELDELMGTKS